MNDKEPKIILKKPRYKDLSDTNSRNGLHTYEFIPIKCFGSQLPSRYHVVKCIDFVEQLCVKKSYHYFDLYYL